jgi:pimeloyl-ACP methyl ester carboxylesterase
MPLIDTANGPIWYADHREHSSHRTVTLMVHGAGGTHLDWPAELRRMPQANAILADLPGHGRSPGPGRQSVGAYAADMLALLDALKIERANIAGHSMGGAVAQTIAIHHPQRVVTLILVGTGAKLGVHPDILNGILTEVSRSVALIVGSYYGPSATEHMRQRSYEQLMNINPTVRFNDYSACNQFDVRADVGRIEAPALIIGGSDDKLTPFKFSEYLHEHLPHSQLVKIEGGGHMMMLEYPAVVAQAVEKWLTLPHEW